jgi:hypothetical protein
MGRITNFDRFTDNVVELHKELAWTHDFLECEPRRMTIRIVSMVLSIIVVDVAAIAVMQRSGIPGIGVISVIFMFGFTFVANFFTGRSNRYSTDVIKYHDKVHDKLRNAYFHFDFKKIDEKNMRRINAAHIIHYPELVADDLLSKNKE